MYYIIKGLFMTDDSEEYYLKSRNSFLPSSPEDVFWKLSLRWNEIASKTKDVSLSSDTDYLSYACLLLANEYGHCFSEKTFKICDFNIKLARMRWSCWFMDYDTEPWRLCRVKDSCYENYINQLTRGLNYHLSDIRLWMINLAWFVRDKLDKERALRLLLENIDNTLGYVRNSMGLAAGICNSDEELEIYIRDYVNDCSSSQFDDRIEKFRNEGFDLSKYYFYKMENHTRKVIESALFDREV